MLLLRSLYVPCCARCVRRLTRQMQPAKTGSVSCLPCGHTCLACGMGLRWPSGSDSCVTCVHTGTCSCIGCRRPAPRYSSACARAAVFSCIQVHRLLFMALETAGSLCRYVCGGSLQRRSCVATPLSIAPALNMYGNV